MIDVSSCQSLCVVHQQSTRCCQLVFCTHVYLHIQMLHVSVLGRQGSQSVFGILTLGIGEGGYRWDLTFTPLQSITFGVSWQDIYIYTSINSTDATTLRSTEVGAERGVSCSWPVPAMSSCSAVSHQCLRCLAVPFLILLFLTGALAVLSCAVRGGGGVVLFCTCVLHMLHKPYCSWW